MITNESLIENYYNLNDKFHNLLSKTEENKQFINQKVIDELFSILKTLQEMIHIEEEVDNDKFKEILNNLNNSYNEIYKEIKIGNKRI